MIRVECQNGDSISFCESLPILRQIGIVRDFNRTDLCALCYVPKTGRGIRAPMYSALQFQREQLLSIARDIRSSNKVA